MSVEREFEPAEPDPGRGWLRSRFTVRQGLGNARRTMPPLPWPRPGHEMACGRHVCPVCGRKS